MSNDETVHVAFTVPAGGRERFLTWLQNTTDQGDRGRPGEPLGYRCDDSLQRRAALQSFADRMETVLRKHDSKTTWRDRPIEALVKLMKLELAEFDVAFEFFEISEVRKELVDIANYAMICDDRLSLLDQSKNAKII